MVPSAIDLNIVIEVGELARGARVFLDAMDVAAVPSVLRRKELEDALAGPPPKSFAFELAHGWSAIVAQPDGPCMLTLRARQLPIPEITAIFARLCRGLLERRRVLTAHSTWASGPAYLPEVPIAMVTRQVVITSPDEVDAAYDRPDAFWNAWEARFDRGDRVLLVRAAAARDSVQYLRAVLDAQWEMARAAMPKRTRYVVSRVAPEEMELFKLGDTPLGTVRYVAEQRTVEMSCGLLRGAHIPGWQIATLLQFIRSKQLPDGTPLDALRIVFQRAGDAEQEKRPLLDIGAQVFVQSKRITD